jgi:hypothetical protein
LVVTTKVDNTNGGTKKPSDFTITVSGNSPKPASFAGSSSATTVSLHGGKYSVSSSTISGYKTTYSSLCSGTITGAKNINMCTITNQYSLIGSLTFLNVITKVDNTNGGTKKPSDFTISVSGNSPSPRTFTGSSDGKSVTLKSGTYEVTEESIPDYSTSYSSGCSGTASGGVPIKCTVTNQYHGPPSPPIKPTITITAYSTSVYSIPSTFVKVDRFGANYTIIGKMSFVNASRNLITSTIVDDFDKNPNIGYVVNNSSSPNTSAQPGLPNPFVSNETIIQKITNETQNAITVATNTNPAGKNVEIKCSFGMILADYKCSLSNQSHTNPAPPPNPVRQANTTISRNSTSVYSIPSTYVKVNRFSTNYTIAGNVSSISASNHLITSTIVDDFDKNPNIGYVVNSSKVLNITSLPGLPAPFVSKDLINQKITNETQNAIAAVSATNPTGKQVEIKCSFGMILADYKCS